MPSKIAIYEVRYKKNPSLFYRQEREFSRIKLDHQSDKLSN